MFLSKRKNKIFHMHNNNKKKKRRKKKGGEKYKRKKKGDREIWGFSFYFE